MGLLLKMCEFPFGDLELVAVLGPGMPEAEKFSLGLSAKGRPLWLGAALLGLAGHSYSFSVPGLASVCRCSPHPLLRVLGFGSQPVAA